MLAKFGISRQIILIFVNVKFHENPSSRISSDTVAYRGGGVGGFNPPPPPEIPEALHNRAKLNPVVKTDKNCSI